MPPVKRLKLEDSSSSEGSDSGEEEDLEVVREAEAQVSVQELPPASGNGLPIVSYRMCILCAELSHMQQDCPMEELDFDICLAMSGLNAKDAACISAYKGITTRENIWFLDTAATSHMGIHKNCLQNCKAYSSRGVKVGNGQIEPITAVGDFHGMKLSKDGRWQTVVLKDFKGVKNLWVNLISGPKCIDEGWTIGNEGRVMTLTKGSVVIRFDIIIPSGDSFFSATEIIPMGDVCNTMLEAGQTMKMKDFHEIFGHSNEETVRATAKSMDVKITGNMKPCEHCFVSKSKQKNVPKVTETKITVAGERLFVDISSVKFPSFGGSKFWLLLMDDASSKTDSFFLKEKSELATVTVSHIRKLKKEGYNVKFIRLDNAGENKTLKKMVEDASDLDLIVFEFTPPHSPQFNRAERKFAVLWARTRAILNAAMLEGKLRAGLWCEAARFSEVIENQLVRPVNVDKGSHYVQFYKKVWKGITHLQKWGTVAVVKTATKIQNKLKDKGSVMIYLGPAMDHAADVHRFYNPRLMVL